MDALALLCNLYANGPSTLERLRHSDCDHLSMLEGLPLDELERCLGATPARAQRFLAEARILRDRLGTSLLEPQERLGEDSLDPRPAGPTAIPPVAPPPPEAPRSEAAPVVRGLEDSQGDCPVEDSLGDRPMIDAVLDAWRVRDSVQPPAPLAGDAPGAGAEPGEHSAGPNFLVPRRRASSSGTALAEAALGGLDAAALAALEAASVSTAEDLLATSSAEIVRETGLPFTRIVRWQFLARRAGFAPRPRRDPPAAPAGPHPAGRAPEAGAGKALEDAAGPFA